MIYDLIARLHGAKRVYSLPLELLAETYDNSILGLAWDNKIWVKFGLSPKQEEFVVFHELKHIDADNGKGRHPDCKKDAKEYAKISEFYNFPI